MPAPSARRPASVRAVHALVLLATVFGAASCGTKGDNTLGVSLIEDRGDRKAVRFVQIVADSSAAFQSSVAAGDGATATSLLVTARPGYLSRALLRFPSSALPAAGTALTAADLDLPYRGGFGTTSFALEAHRVTAAWTEVTTAPDSFPAYDPVPFLTVDVPFSEAALDTFTLSLTALAQAWADDTTSNFGVALVPAPTETGELELDARESTTPPRLTVRWTDSGADSSRNATPTGDLYALGSTPAFVPLWEEPRRMTVSRGFAGRSFVRFAWTDPGLRSTIHRAELTLHLDAARSSSSGFAIGERRVNAEPWNGFSTDVDGTIQGIRTVTADQDSVVLDVTNVVIQWLQYENHGIEIRASDERPDTDYLRFHAYDTEVPGLVPTLRVWWTPGDAPEDAP